MFGKRNGVKPANTQSNPGSSSSWAGRSDSPRETSFSRSPGNIGSSPRIDPEILLDTQSNGLSSRIVKYYEENQRMSRSPRTVYNKPGQFPIVHLKKNEIVYSTKRNNPLSVVKIAPPDKSVSDRNLRLNILRQGLSTPTAPPDDYIEPHKWHDNEPLTPSEGIESTPTRSVLDALTEISRKRIHNEDFNGDRSKKHCKDFTEVDGPQTDLRAVQTKRQRDKVSPPSPAEGQASVESTKKKVCRNSHDILSSLSSSIRLLNPKRRIEDVLAGDAKRTHYQRPQATVEPQKRSPVASVEPQRRPDLPSSQKLTPVMSSTPLNIVPPPAKPQAPKPTPKITLFNQNYDRIKERVLSDTEDDEKGKSLNLVRPKPGGKLLVKDKKESAKGSKSKLAIMLSYLSRNFEDEDEDTVDGKEEEKKPEEAKKEEVKTPEAPKPVPVISSMAKPPEPQTPIVTISKPSEEPKKLEDGPSATSTPQVPQIKFGIPATEAPSKISPILSMPVASTGNTPNPSAEIVQAEVKSQPSAFKVPASTAPISFPAPISFGSTVTSAPVLSVAQTTSALSVAPSAVSSGAFAPLPSSSSSSIIKTASPFTMAPGIAGSALAAASKSPPKPVAFPSGKLDFNFGATQPASLSTATATTSSSASAPSNSLFQFKPATTSITAASIAPASAPSFTFGTTPATQTSAPDTNFTFTPANASTLKPLTPGSVITPKKTNLFMFGGGGGGAGGGGNGAETTTSASSFPASTFTTTSSGPSISGGFTGNAFGGFSSNAPATTATTASTDVKALFTFGPATSAPTQTSQTPFTFGAPAQATKPAVTSAASSAAFSFEKKTPFDAVSTAGSSVFGGGTATTASIFGNANATSATTAAATFPASSNLVFGTASVPVFGAAAAATSTASATTTTSAFGSGGAGAGAGGGGGGSIFSGGSPFGGGGGGSGQPQGSTAFGGFGGSSGNVAKPVTTSTVSPFAFGGGQENKTTTSGTSSAGIFGAAPAAPNAFGTSDKPFSFGGGAAAAAPFQFGGGGGTGAATTTSGSPFSFSTPNTTAPPAFGGASSGGTFTFGQTEAPKPPAPAFGSGVTVFGGQHNSGNPPAFGATNSAPAFNFTGSGAAAQPPGTPQAPFAFGAAGANQQGGSPMFSIGSTGQTAQRRPYRHATRRLNK